MPGLKHSSKRAIATRLKRESRDSRPLFETAAWERRKEQIAARHQKKNAGEHARAEKRKKEKAKKSL